ncbi:class F sortase [Agreia bicolorata]|uniref:class F sortase n=1 Tax=Agreia bicolorata TaxID=110935 RepID=UPI000ABB0FA1|nr:class F sortase [Agreia bicolorata]
MPELKSEGRRRRWIFLTVGAVAVVTLIVAGVGISQYFSAPVDLQGNRVLYEDFNPPSAKESGAIAQHGTDRFVVDSVGLDVPLGSLNSVKGVIEPPEFTSAYWVRDYGVAPADAATGTVFVVMHSLRNGGSGPGNYLIDVDKRTSKVALGAKIVVDDKSYTVTGSQVIDKPDVAKASDVWAEVPGRLVVITCLQRADGATTTQNVVIEAQEDTAQ